MPDPLQNVPHIHCALICVEAPLDDAGMPTALPRIFGKPAIFHQVKQLHRFGVNDIIMSVDAVPAELPQLIEQLCLDGNNVRLMRSNGSAADDVGFQHPFLLISPDIWVDDVSLQDALLWKSNSIGIVEEEPANYRFERIDLNRRWSGIAVLEANLLQHSTSMPEGWNLASFLLRHALQLGAKEIAISQKRVTDGSLLKISNESEYENVAATILSAVHELGALESAIGTMGRRLISPVSQNLWLAAVFAYAPMALSLFSAGLANANFAGWALALLISALCLEVFRQQIRSTEYYGKSKDYLRIAGQITGLATVATALWRGGESLSDAIFLTAVGSGLIMMSYMAPTSRSVRFISPLTVAILLIAGFAFGALSVASKVSIATMLALNIWSLWRQQRTAGQLNSN
ncbi:MAG: hypothetical protein WA793_04210 [Sphingorhabdus sp.]|uniref:hypothetical protein n=1 Tax=Sphingorhabdus sp. TaxID=1902408 RepID=UPI003CADCC2C